MKNIDALNHIYKHQIVAIIRGIAADKAKDVALALAEGGVKILEITLNSPKALHVIEQLADALGDEILIGAGTVLDAESAQNAMYAGARFILSPTLNLATIQMTRRHGAISIPGAFTPTEILNAYTYGGDIVKVFPATSALNYIKDIKGPLPHIPIMPTGGIGLDNIKDFKKIGAVAFGIGSSLVDAKQTINAEYLNQLTRKAQQFVEAIK